MSRLLSSLPPFARDLSPQALPLLRRRLIPPPVGDIAVARRKALKEVVSPYSAHPDRFVNWLVDLEQALGTRDATLIGCLTVSRVRNLAQMLNEIECFDRFAASIAHFHHSPQSLANLLIHLCKYDVENVNRRDIHQSLQALERNLSLYKQGGTLRDFEPSVRCTAAAAIHGTLEMTAGREVGAMSSFYGPHVYSMTISAKGHFVFDVVKYESKDVSSPYECRFNPLREDDKHKRLRLSSFCFIPHMILAKFVQIDEEYFPLSTLPHNQLVELSNLYSCALAIDPYNASLYHDHYFILEALGYLEKADQASAWGKVIGNLSSNNDGLPAL
ncbi:MAG: hypothetical protein WC890_04920 [Candidatus Margulisiibacteriota bacterium]